MATRLAIPALLLVLTLLNACGNGDEGPDRPADAAFSLEIVVRDPDGRPVSGLAASLSPEVAGVHWPHADGTAAFATAGARDLPDPLIVQMDVFAVDGRRVRHLVREGNVATPTVPWDGCDDAGQPQHDGWYEGRLSTAPDIETPPQEILSRPLLLISGSPEHCAAGVTDAAGRIRVEDRTYVPAFWDVEPIEILGPDGEVVETLEVTPRTRVVLLAADGATMSQVFEAVDGPQTLRLVWAP